MHQNTREFKKEKEMEDRAIQYFVEGLTLVQNELYLDASHKFAMLAEEFPESDLADDALYNVGLCYFKMKQFEMAIETFQQDIHNYPDATISLLDVGNSVGKTAAKCYYSIVLANLALGRVKMAKEIALQLDLFSEDTYVIVDNHKKTYAELAVFALRSVK